MDNLKNTNQEASQQAESLDGSQGSPALRAPDMIPGPLKPFTSPIDYTKPVRVRGGKWEVRILAIDHALPKPVIGRLVGSGLSLDRRVSEWYLNGLFNEDGGDTCLDLENVPEAVNPSPSPMGEK